MLVLYPQNAFAWGAGVHLGLGSYLLDNMYLLPSAIQTLLLAYPHDFLYGCISADITVGKRFTHYLNHCHAWGMGKKILQAAETDAQKSCAYGYLSHLAADTIAHSYFVPFKMVRTFNTVLLKHTYWEIRSESHVDPQIWKLAKQIASEDFRHNDAMMRNVLSNTIFSFKTNKRIFNSILLLSRLRHWQKMLLSLSSSSKWTLENDVLEEYFDIAREASVSILCTMEASPFWNADPTGEKAIGVAKGIRKKMIKRWFEDRLSGERTEKIISELKPMFYDRITRPDSMHELFQIIP
jgi:hypothetical protein